LLGSGNCLVHWVLAGLFLSSLLSDSFHFLSLFVIASAYLMVDSVFETEFRINVRPSNYIVHLRVLLSFALLATPGIVLVFLCQTSSLGVAGRSIAHTLLFE